MAGATGVTVKPAVVSAASVSALTVRVVVPAEKRSFVRSRLPPFPWPCRSLFGAVSSLPWLPLPPLSPGALSWPWPWPPLSSACELSPPPPDPSCATAGVANAASAAIERTANSVRVKRFVMVV